MSPTVSGAARVLGFLAALAVIFAATVGVGRAVGPVSEPAAPGHDAHGADASGHAGHAEGGEMEGMAGTGGTPGGLMVSQNGYTLNLAERQAGPGPAVPVAFTINGPDGRPVTSYDVEHEKKLHFIAVRRDQTGFQHVHPVLQTNGLWTTRLDLTPGEWRLFADFKASGADPLVLGTDLSVPGRYVPAPPAAGSRIAEVDGYTVALDGDLKAGADTELRLSVLRDGLPVTDLQPYLDAYGHLVALRAGDLAYLHLHPDGTPGDGHTSPGPDVVFHASVPSTGTYRLYLDFQHRGVVRTAAFTVTTSGTANPPSTHESTADHESH